MRVSEEMLFLQETHANRTTGLAAHTAPESLLGLSSNGVYSSALVRRIFSSRLKYSVRHKDPCNHRNVPQNVVPDKGQLGRVDPENYTPHACQDDRHGVFKFSGSA